MPSDDGGSKVPLLNFIFTNRLAIDDDDDVCDDDDDDLSDDDDDGDDEDDSDDDEDDDGELAHIWNLRAR